jgi:3',5'-cyclic AMP phosphodiesterase CpdA
VKLRLLLTTLLLLAAAACGGSDASEESQPPASDVPAAPGEPGPSGSSGAAPTATNETVENLRVAFTGDQGLGDDSVAVLELVEQEDADMLIILGDFDYDDDPDAWDAMLTDALGADYPIFAAVGNHDTDEWEEYQAKLTDRLARISGAACEGDYGVNAACTFQGLFFILSGIGTLGEGHEDYLAEQLEGNDSIWSICAWHKNQEAMQVGDKSDSVGWEAYEMCRESGAIIATAHEHSYQRTKTLSNVEDQEVDSEWSDPNALRVGGGSSFVFVSGLGGNSIRDQERCEPDEPPYGCSGEWASIYTEDQDAQYGVLFIDFRVDGDPRKAEGYFKNIDGEVIDQFTIVSQR